MIDCGSDCAETVDSGTKVKLTATAASGHRFTGWTGCDSASGAVCTQTVNGNETVTANFVQRFALTVSKSPSAGGSVSGSTVSDAGTVLTSGVIDCGSDCAETVDSGTKMKLTATASSGHRFTGWTGCDSANGSVCTQTVNGNETVTANFSKEKYKLKIDPKPTNGYVMGNDINCGSGTGRTTCEVRLDHGKNVSLSATADMNYWFKGWTGEKCSGTVGDCVFRILSDTTISADFQPYDFIYRLASSKPATPTGGTTNEQHAPSGWTRTKPSPTGERWAKPSSPAAYPVWTTAQPVWRAQRKRHYSNEEFSSATAWGGVAKIEDLDFIYIEPTSIPATPTGGEMVETHTPSGWTRIPAYLLVQSNPTFRAERTRHYKNGRFARASSWGGVKELLTVNPGGPYQAGQEWRRSHYTVTVWATARGGTSPYSYRWEGKSSNSRSATYLFRRWDIYFKSVAVTDEAGNAATASTTITVIQQPPRIGGASDDSAHEVPLDGTLVFIWGGSGSVSATSDDTSIATVSVSGTEIVVSGVSAGRTEIVVKPAESEFRMPVQVGGGG